MKFGRFFLFKTQGNPQLTTHHAKKVIRNQFIILNYFESSPKFAESMKPSDCTSFHIFSQSNQTHTLIIRNRFFFLFLFLRISLIDTIVQRQFLHLPPPSKKKKKNHFFFRDHHVPISLFLYRIELKFFLFARTIYT